MATVVWPKGMWNIFVDAPPVIMNRSSSFVAPESMIVVVMLFYFCCVIATCATISASSTHTVSRVSWVLVMTYIVFVGTLAFIAGCFPFLSAYDHSDRHSIF